MGGPRRQLLKMQMRVRVVHAGGSARLRRPRCNAVPETGRDTAVAVTARGVVCQKTQRNVTAVIGA